MCEANAYFNKDGQQKLLMEAVDLVETLPDGKWRLINIYGEQLQIKASVDHLELGSHKLYFKSTD